MNVISRIQFPKTNETADLYVKLDQGVSLDFSEGDRKIFLPQGSTISLNTYFNSIYEKFYTKYTFLSSLYYLLKLEGDFEVFVYRETSEANVKQLIHEEKLYQCQISDCRKVSLPVLHQNQEAGRIYLEITCLSEQGYFTEGLVVTEQEKQRDVSLGIISCTFKKEAYIKKTVSLILEDIFLENKKFKIFVVDNGNTLSKNDFEDGRVHLISNRNVGGSGGFTRGLIEALQEGVSTHFLFMDDDIELDSEVIYRLIALYEYAKQDFAVAGSMLDLYKKYIVYEVGSLYNKYFDSEGNLQHRPFTITGLKPNLDLRNSNSLNFLLLEDNIDYGGFWFFSFSKEIVNKVGLPLPLFIKTDDIEFCLRIKEHFKNGIVAFPSFAVWHEPFYSKKPVWDLYYEYRNRLIINAIHNSLRYFDTIKILTRALIFHLLIFDYNSANMIVKGFEDYMEGPSFMTSHDPEILHSWILEYSKGQKSQTILANYIMNHDGNEITKPNKFQKILSLITLNGHLLPIFLVRDETVIIRYGSKERDFLSHPFCRGFAKKRIIFAMENNHQVYQNEMDNQAGISILFAWINSVLKSRLKWSNVRAEWKKAASSLTSVQFWQNYLEPQNKTKSQQRSYVKPGEVL
jgi:galactofuranosylgalactofuranosylrhamnosyl-N-acetylglucosaminyl-diphospho-decaprenol beta-1,5/1,6-galactofuranosyltransferase